MKQNRLVKVWLEAVFVIGCLSGSMKTMVPTSTHALARLSIPQSEVGWMDDDYWVALQENIVDCKYEPKSELEFEPVTEETV